MSPQNVAINSQNISALVLATKVALMAEIEQNVQGSKQA